MILNKYSWTFFCTFTKIVTACSAFLAYITNYDDKSDESLVPKRTEGN